MFVVMYVDSYCQSGSVRVPRFWILKEAHVAVFLAFRCEWLVHLHCFSLAGHKCRSVTLFARVFDKNKNNLWKIFRTLNGEQKIDALNEIIEESKHIVFLGGAGVSTESGIPDFRSKDGLYNKKGSKFRKYKPEYLLSYDCLNKKPEIFFSYFRKNLDCRTLQPNDAHKKLAEMEQKGKLDGIVTQNIDGLHQKAGQILYFMTALVK